MLKSIIICSLFMGVFAGPAMTEQTDLHATWDGLLKSYVVESPDGVNRFDYGALKKNPGDLARLQAYLKQFEQLEMAALGPNEQFAAYANIYNALTVLHIVGRYPVDSIRSGYFPSGPWKRVKTDIGGKAVSLDALEHDILRPMGEARVHYVINCASYSCPNLRRSALTPAKLEDDLNAAARDYINHPRGVAVRSRGGLRVSEIYKWFRDDFGGDEASLIAHFMDYASPELAAQIRANPDIKSYSYDWSLNDVSGSGNGG